MKKMSVSPFNPVCFYASYPNEKITAIVVKKTNIYVEKKKQVAGIKRNNKVAVIIIK
jgi:hypothetical protein